MDLIKSLRLQNCLLLLAIGLIGFAYSNLPRNMLVLLTLFFISVTTMLQNDWRDRIHDLKKNKTFAYNRPGLYKIWLLIFWVIGIALILIVFREHMYAGIILSYMAVIALIYSEVRRVPFLSVTLVTITTASPLFLPIALGASLNPEIIILIIAVTLIMFGRETLHDVADMHADVNYKKTIPILLGENFARVISTFSLVTGCFFSLIISYKAILGITFILWGLTRVISDKKLKWVRNRIDFGLAILSISLLFL